jgi:hypothetical protein
VVRDLGLWAKSQRDQQANNSTWWRNFVLVVLFVIVVVNSGWIAPSLVVGLWGYLAYYVLWFLNTGWSLCGFSATPAATGKGMQYVRQQAAFAPSPAFRETVHFESPGRPGQTAPVPAQVVAQPKPISAKESLRVWQQQQRKAIQDQGFWTRLHASTRSMTLAGFITAVLTFGGGFLTLSNSQIPSNHWLSGIAWLGIMTTLTTWVILFFSRRWESRSEDSIVFRFILMAAGLLLGAASFQTSEYLMVPWNQMSGIDTVQIEMFDGSINRTWKGFYDADGFPVLAGHMAFFASMMWILRWWRQSDVLRRKRFSVWTIVWSMLLVALVQGIFYFPGPWHVLLAGATSFVVQLASPWQEPRQKSLAA